MGCIRLNRVGQQDIHCAVSWGGSRRRYGCWTVARFQESGILSTKTERVQAKAVYSDKKIIKYLHIYLYTYIYTHMWTWLISNTCWIWRLSHKEGYPLSTHARTLKCCNWPNPSPNMSPNRVAKPFDFISVMEALSGRWRWQSTLRSFVDIRHPICLCRSLILVSVMTFTEP